MDWSIPSLFNSTCPPSLCRSKEPIQLNVWNTINLERSNRKGEIMVNKKDPVRGEAPVSHRASAVEPSAGLDREGTGGGTFQHAGLVPKPDCAKPSLVRSCRGDRLSRCAPVQARKSECGAGFHVGREKESNTNQIPVNTSRYRRITAATI